MSWITPITDRTVEDTRFARNNQGNEQNNKGSLNYDDLNRIENNYKFLIVELRKNAVSISRVYRTEDWNEQSIPYVSDINRIRDNFNSLVMQFPFGIELPTFEPSNRLFYNEVNDWEKIELEIRNALLRTQLSYRYCGTLDCGGDVL